MGGIDFNNLMIHRPHRQRTTHTAKSAYGMRFYLRGSNIGPIFREGVRRQRTGRTYGDAGAAEGTGRMFQRQRMNGCRSRFKSPIIIIDCADDNQFMVCPDTLAAQDAFAQIPYNKRVCLFKGTHIGHCIQVGFADTQVSRYLP